MTAMELLFRSVPVAMALLGWALNPPATREGVRMLWVGIVLSLGIAGVSAFLVFTADRPSPLSLACVNGGAYMDDEVVVGGVRVPELDHRCDR